MFFLITSLAVSTLRSTNPHQNIFTLYHTSRSTLIAISILHNLHPEFFAVYPRCKLPRFSRSRVRKPIFFFFCYSCPPNIRPWRWGIHFVRAKKVAKLCSCALNKQRITGWGTQFSWRLPLASGLCVTPPHSLLPSFYLLLSGYASQPWVLLIPQKSISKHFFWINIQRDSTAITNTSRSVQSKNSSCVRRIHCRSITTLHSRDIEKNT